MNLGRKLSTDVLVTTIFDFATRLRGIVFIPVISGILSVAAYGAYAQLLAIASLLAIVFELGLHGSLVRYAQDDGNTAELYYSLTTFAVVVGVGVATVLYTVATPLSRLVLGGVEYAVVFRIGAVLVPLRIWGNMAGNYFRSEMQIKFFSGLRTARAYLSIVGVLVVLLLLHYGLPGVISVVVGAEFLYVLFLQSIITRRLGIVRPSFEDFTRYLRYSIPLAVSIIAGNLSSRADRILIGYFLGASAVGIYSIVYQFATVLGLLAQPITTAYFPEFSRLIEEGRTDECLAYLEAGIRYFTTIGLPAIAGLYLVGPEIIESLSTEATGEASITILPIIASGIFLFGLDEIYGIIFIASERTEILTFTRGVAAISNVILNLIMIPQFGILGAAIATMMSYGVGLMILIHKLKGYFTVSIDYYFMGKCGVASISMASIFTILNSNIVLTIATAPLFYFAILFVFRGYTYDEVKRVKNELVNT
ncbi:flippase [Halococcus sp. AFM35]|uniref:flippase n=1 Tax=Halococcus sp. AFM35 TaxID=3421653 RepID=UPI003EBFF566